MTAHAISVGGLSKSFGDERVLTDVDLDVTRGEFCVVVGPSGCGKTTLLKCIAGLEDADAGRVVLRGNDVDDLRVRDAGVGFVFQEFEETLFPHKTVAENVAFGLEQQDATDRAAVEARVDEVLELLAIPETRDDTPGELSGGQQQRVEIARQLVRDCDTLLLDDPLSDLDYKLQKRMEIELRRIHDDAGSTFVYVTHNQEQALKLADRIVVMNRGRIEQVGPPREVYERPATAYVGRFVGDSNLLEAGLRDADGADLTVETTIGPVAATAQSTSVDHPEESVVLVRPRDVAIGADAEAGDTVRRGTLVDRTYTGESTEFAVAVTGPDGETVDVTAVEPGETTAGRIDEDVTVGWNARACRYFDSLSVTGDVTVEDLRQL